MTDLVGLVMEAAATELSLDPRLYALGAAGAEGVSAAVNILRREFEMAMALTGRRTLADVDRSVLWS